MSYVSTYLWFFEYIHCSFSLGYEHEPSEKKRKTRMNKSIPEFCTHDNKVINLWSVFYSLRKTLTFDDTLLHVLYHVDTSSWWICIQLFCECEFSPIANLTRRQFLMVIFLESNLWRNFNLRKMKNQLSCLYGATSLKDIER